MERVDYETRYRHIYIKISEFVLAVQKVSVYRDYAIPLVKKIITNYDRFRIEINSSRERWVCDEYIKSLEKLVEIMQNKISSYEKYREEQLDII